MVLGQSTVDMIGALAGALVLATFLMRSMLWLRVLAICSNVAFLSYGIILDLLPIWLLHSMLLPINCWRSLSELSRNSGSCGAPVQDAPGRSCAPGQQFVCTCMVAPERHDPIARLLVRSEQQEASSGELGTAARVQAPRVEYPPPAERHTAVTVGGAIASPMAAD